MTLIIDIVGELGALASLHPAGAIMKFNKLVRTSMLRGVGARFITPEGWGGPAHRARRGVAPPLLPLGAINRAPTHCPSLRSDSLMCPAYLVKIHNRAPTHSTSLRSSFFWQFDSSILIMGIADEYIGMLEQDDGTCKQNYRKVPVIQYA